MSAAAARRRTALVESSRVRRGSVAGCGSALFHNTSIYHRRNTPRVLDPVPVVQCTLEYLGHCFTGYQTAQQQGNRARASPSSSIPFLPFVNNLSTWHSFSVASTHCAIFHAIYCLFIMSFLYDNNNNAGLSSQVEFVPIAVESHGPINRDALQFQRVGQAIGGDDRGCSSIFVFIPTDFRCGAAFQFGFAA